MAPPLSPLAPSNDWAAQKAPTSVLAAEAAPASAAELWLELEP